MIVKVDNLDCVDSIRRALAVELHKVEGAYLLDIQSFELDTGVANKNKNKYIEFADDGGFKLRKGKSIKATITGNLYDKSLKNGLKKTISLLISLDKKSLLDIIYDDSYDLLHTIEMLLIELKTEALCNSVSIISENGDVVASDVDSRGNKGSIYIGANCHNGEEIDSNVHYTVDDCVNSYVKEVHEVMNRRGNWYISHYASRLFKKLSVQTLLEEIGFQHYGEMPCKIDSLNFPVVDLDIWYLHNLDTVYVLSAIKLEVYFLGETKHQEIYSRMDRYLRLEEVVYSLLNIRLMSREDRDYYENAFFKILHRY